MTERWKKAVIHLECARDSMPTQEKITNWRELQRKRKNGLISEEEFIQEISLHTRDIRYHGSGIFLKHDSKRYLITACHVVHNEQDNGLGESIFNMIFRVPSFDEIITHNPKRPEFLMNLGAGPTWMRPYLFDMKHDLAIISLDQYQESFGDDLMEMGYNPISMGDIGEEPSNEFAEIMAVGYPETVAAIGKLELTQAEQNWSSHIYSLPVISYGKVAMLHKQLYYFWGDITVIPGNSGGPIIESDKLVGITSEQATIPTDIKVNGNFIPDERRRVRVPFAWIIKAKYVKELVKVQINKEKSLKEI